MAESPSGIDGKETNFCSGEVPLEKLIMPSKPVDIISRVLANLIFKLTKLPKELIP